MATIDIKNCSDAELVSLALKKIDYFEEIIERYRSILLRYIRRISSFSQESCEEVLQDGFLKIWKNLNDYDPKMKFSTWVYRIMYTTTISHWREEKKHHMNKYKGEYEIEEFSEHIALDNEIMDNADIKVMKRAVSALPIRYREIIILRYWEGKSYDELTDILQKPKGTVAILLKRAKEKLKKEFEKITRH